jgi:hypothetical protein
VGIDVDIFEISSVDPIQENGEGLGISHPMFEQISLTFPEYLGGIPRSISR